MNNSINQEPLDDYNPFSEPAPKYEYKPSPVLEVGADSAIDMNPPMTYSEAMNATAMMTPHQTKHSSSVANDAVLALERRQAELEARAAELDRREKEQQARMQSLQSGPAPHNWPPFPAFCPCKPCVRQDFEADIPFDCRWMAKMGYGLWLAYTLTLLLNMGGTLGYFIVGKFGYEGPLFGASILLLLVMPPLTFFGWHRPLYKALRSDSSKNYLIFFILFAAQIVILLIQCLGIDYLGSCGWINSLKTCQTSKAVGAYMLVVAGLFTALAACSALLIFKVHRHYRSSGASLRKAKLEMTTAAAYEATAGFGAMP